MERNTLAAFSLLFFAALSCAQALYEDPFTIGLDASISVSNNTFTQPQGSVYVLAELENTYPTEQAIMLLKETPSGGWEKIKTIGVIEPGQKANATITIAVEYAMAAKKKTRYALVASGIEGAKGKYFEVFEDWSGYEESVRKDIASATFIAVPIIGAILAITMLVLVKVAYSSHPVEAYKGEYSTKSLFIPKMAGLSFGEKIADFYMTPAAWMMETAGLLMLVFVMYTTLSSSMGTVTELMQIMALAGIGAASMPVIYFAAAWLYNEKSEKKPLRLFAAMFFWGIFAAVLSLGFNTLQAGILKGKIDESLMLLLGVAVIVPIIEEVIKGAGLLMVSSHHEFDDELTGIMLGFSVGLGFSFVENWFYFASKTNPFEAGFVSWAGLVLYRSFFNSLAHGCFTAAAGGIVGYVKSHQGIARFAQISIVPGIVASVALHMVFNLSALLDGFTIASQHIAIFIFNPMLVIMLASAFVIAVLLAELDRSSRLAKSKKVAP